MSDAAVFQQYPMMMVNEAAGTTVIAINAEAEARYIEQGFSAPGKSDAEAFAMAHSGAPAAYEPQRYPMWCNGVLVKDAKEERAAMAGKIKPAPQYPIEISISGGLQRITVHSREEHERHCGPLDLPPAPRPEISAAEWEEFQRAKAAGAIPALTEGKPA